MLKKVLLVYLLIISPCIFASFSHNEVLKALHFQSTLNNRTHLKILLIINAQDGMIVPDQNDIDQYIIKMKHVNSEVVYFADIPSHQSGHMPLNRFVQLWEEGVCANKDFTPNASLVIRQQNGKKHITENFYTLLQPQYYVKSDQLNITARNIGIKRHLASNNLKHISLFVYEQCY